MPENNRFRHQPYPTTPSMDPVVRDLTVEPDEPVDLSRLHTRLGVQQVLLVHGTFMGTDPIGVHAMMSGLIERRASPAMQIALKPLVAKLSEQTKRVTDVMTGEVANYNESYRRKFQELCGGDPLVRRLEWSSTNNHLARAGLAVKLVNWLADREAIDGLVPGRDRVLLWGHSHAGNGFALLSNLLANDRDSVASFFEACGDALGEDGELAKAILAASPTPHPWADSLLIATFGTPVRYGWDTNGYRQLVHVTHHRAFDSEHPERTIPAVSIGCEGDQSFVQTQRLILDVLAARHGDWVQTFAIAGTDLPGTGHKEQDQALRKLLEANLEEATPLRIRERFPIVCRRWQTATRLHTDGRNLLIEYEKKGVTRFGFSHQAVLGHGIYTLGPWLPAQLGLVIEWMERDAA